MVKLAPLQPEHVAHFYTWLRDPDVTAYSLSVFQGLKSTEQIDQWFATTLAQANTLNLGIYWQETNALIGYAGLTGISPTNHAGEYFIFIGEKTLWGKGIGTAVTKQILHLGFTRHQLNRIMLESGLRRGRAPATGGLSARRVSRQACDVRVKSRMAVARRSSLVAPHPAGYTPEKRTRRTLFSKKTF
jgi:hypothetical protein